MTRATYGAAAQKGFGGKLPTVFPRTMGPNAAKYVQEVLDAGLASGMVDRFENAFAAEHGVKHCITAPGCTPALASLAAALPFEPGDEIIVSPITDYGTIQGIVHQHYIPVFADTEPDSVNLNAETIEACITDRTRAILVVHKTGIVCDMDPIIALAKRHDLMLFEDACQAVFGEYKGRLAGTLSDAGAFSFDCEKTMGGDTGGCIITNDDELAERIRFAGLSRGAEMREGFGRIHSIAGYAHRMPQCTAATCLAQLEIAREQVAQRDRMARLLTRLIDDVPGVQALPIPDYCNVYSCWMFGLTIDTAAFTCDANAFAGQLAAAGIPGAGTGAYYLMPDACTFLHKHASEGRYPYSQPPASRTYDYAAQAPRARAFLQRFIRWATFCERYTEEHCELAAEIIRTVADANRR